MNFPWSPTYRMLALPIFESSGKSSVRVCMAPLPPSTRSISLARLGSSRASLTSRLLSATMMSDLALSAGTSFSAAANGSTVTIRRPPGPSFWKAGLFRVRPMKPMRTSRALAPSRSATLRTVVGATRGSPVSCQTRFAEIRSKRDFFFHCRKAS